MTTDRTTPSIRSMIITVFTSMLLSTGFTFMYGTAIQIDIKILPALILTLIFSVAFTVIHSLNGKNLSTGALIAAPALFVVMLIFNIFKVKDGLLSFLYYIKLYAFYWFPGIYVEPEDGDASLFAFLMAYNLAAVCVTAYVMSKRSWIPGALLNYLPLFIVSVANIVMRPSQVPCLIAASGVFMLLLAHVLRNKKPATAERALLILTVPVAGLTLLTAVVFPESRYGRDKWASDFLESIQESVEKASGKDDPVSRMIETALHGFNNPNGDSNSDIFSPLYSTMTNLSKVGPFDPPQDRILTVYRKNNPGYDGSTRRYNGHILYIKVESLDKYENNKLSSTPIRNNIYLKDYEPELQEAQYSLTITPLENSGVDIVPYYTDFYTMQDLSTSKVSPFNTTHEGKHDFAASSLPVKTGNIYSEWYVKEYVYKTALRVPKATENALTMSGKLPDWYLDVFWGRVEMSDADKVRGVTEFVRNLHPYDINTEMPPEDVDFVPWFVSDAESGICVHYAITSVILLRMIGVPARYVRGYVDTRSYDNAESVIYASQAHAWFEFFVPEYGWIMGDSTPGYAQDAANFNIDAVSKVSPDIETASFSRGNYTYEPPETTSASETSETTSESEPSTPSGSTPTPPVPDGQQQTGPSMPTDPGVVIFTGNDHQSDGKARELTAFEKGLIKSLLTILITAVSVWLLLMLFKLVFFLYWKNRFDAESINDKAVAYYHYYCLMGRIFRFQVPQASSAIAEKAAFSENGLTPKELNMLLTDCKEHMTACSKSFSRIRLSLYRLLEIKVRGHK